MNSSGDANNLRAKIKYDVIYVINENLAFCQLRRVLRDREIFVFQLFKKRIGNKMSEMDQKKG